MRGFMIEFKNTLRRLRGQIIGWGIGLGLYGLMMGAMFNTVSQLLGLEEMIASYPPEFMAFFGDVAKMASPGGYFDTYYSSYMPLILGIFAVGAAAGLLAGDEERGTLDLVMSYPVGRDSLFWGRWFGFAAALLLVVLLGYTGWLIPLPGSGMEITALELLRPFVPLFALMLLFGGLSLLLSLSLPSSRLASMVAGLLLVANFLLAGLANLNDDMKAIMEWTPFHFTQGGDAMEGLNAGPLAGLLVVALLLAVAAWTLFRRRDIRVGGERGWSWRPVSRSTH